MSRVGRASVMCVASLILFGCATGTPPEPEAKRVAPARTKIVKVGQTCTTTLEPENICAHPRHCYEVKSCAEAYYRFTVCKDLSLDDSPLGKDVPHKPGQPNGIPCEKQCGRDALTMADRIREQPFSPRQLSVTVCRPAS